MRRRVPRDRHGRGCRAPQGALRTERLPIGLAAIPNEHRDVQCRIRQRSPKLALADAGYCSETNLETALERQLACSTGTFTTTGRLVTTSRQAANRKKKGAGGGRPLSHDADLYEERNTVERLISKLKAWRGIATRYDKTPDSYLAGLHLRASMIWIKDLTRTAD
ncbi:transposase [Streptomyces sp. NPDC059460]|uniref:transposase n=1 Tax=Streptomyces sp. NPDC059460 TaxID=3346840 RepID=UPI0036B1BFE2